MAAKTFVSSCLFITCTVNNGYMYSIYMHVAVSNIFENKVNVMYVYKHFNCFLLYSALNACQQKVQVYKAKKKKMSVSSDLTDPKFLL